MKQIITLAIAATMLAPLGAAAQNKEKTVSLEVTNTWKLPRTDAPVVLKDLSTIAGFGVKSATVMDGTVEVASQLDDLNDDLVNDQLAFVTNLKAGERKTFKVMLSSVKSGKTYTPRVYAEMLLSDKSKQDKYIGELKVMGNANVYNLLHHHGPAFESELVAYRVYFDQKQTIDPYGKFNKGFEIKESQFYPTDAQLARGFGDDVLLVGSSCGVGALKGWDGTKATHIEPVHSRTERIVSYGPIRTIVEAEARGWKYHGKTVHMTNRYILYAGHRDLLVETCFTEPLAGEDVFCTGVTNVKGSTSYSDHQGLIGCWGTDWPVNDTIKYHKETVGLATYVPRAFVGEEVKDRANYLYTVKHPGGKSFHHYTTFTSMKETFGYKTPKAWFDYIQIWKDELEHPVAIRLL